MTYYSTDFKAFPKWQRVLPALQGITPPQNAQQDLNTLDSVNKRYNALKYNDKDLDHWQTPDETLKRGGGDCADLAIAKYRDLLKAGIPDDNMRVVVGTLGSGQIHSVLHVKMGDKDYILDNQAPTVMDKAKYDDGYMKMLYGINRQGWDRY